MASTTAAGFASGMDAASAVMPAQGAGDSARGASSGDAFGATMSETLRENGNAARVDAPAASSPAGAAGTAPAGSGNDVPAPPPTGTSEPATDSTAAAGSMPAAEPASSAANDDSLARLLADIDAMRGAATTADPADAGATEGGDAATGAEAAEDTATDADSLADVDASVDPALLACAVPTAQAPVNAATASASAFGALGQAQADGQATTMCDAATAAAGSPPGATGSQGAKAAEAAGEPIAAALADGGQALDGQADPGQASTAADALAAGAADTRHGDAAAATSADASALQVGGASHAHQDDGGGSLPRTDGVAAAPAGEARPGAPARTSAMGELFAQLQPSGLAEQVSQRVVWMHQLGVHLARMQVHPSDLGPIDIALDQRDGSIAVSMTAHHPATRELLESHLPRMREQLAADGTNIERFDVFGGDGRGDDGREAQEGARDGRGREDARDTIEAAPAIRLPIRAAGLFEAYA